MTDERSPINYVWLETLRKEMYFCSEFSSYDKERFSLFEFERKPNAGTKNNILYSSEV